MSWNYRVIRHVYTHSDGEQEEYFNVHEVYYDEQGAPNGITADAVNPQAESLEGLRWTLDQYIKALDKPIIDFEDMAKSKKNSPKNHKNCSSRKETSNHIL